MSEPTFKNRPKPNVEPYKPEPRFVQIMAAPLYGSTRLMALDSTGQIWYHVSRGGGLYTNPTYHWTKLEAPFDE